jgi:uncharacterized membrane protein
MSTEPAPASPRLDSIDILRGLVMAVMALDHVRDYFSNARFDPTDLQQTTPAYFLTRFVTHYCAPVFVFLAGTGAFLASQRGKTRSELSLFLLTRGLWLVMLELTVVRFGWTLQFDLARRGAGVLWAIGWSMVVLSALVFLPRLAVLAFGLAMIAVHNAFDGVESLGTPFLDGLWTILHRRGQFQVTDGFSFGVIYPLIPWIGVLAAGYGFGELLIGTQGERRSRVRRVGVACCIAFVVVRAINGYGDSQPWSQQQDALFTVLSFVNCTKYPPSLDYLLMTLGPALLLLSFLPEKASGGWRPFVVLGRVPLFYYLLHIPLIHVLARIANPSGLEHFGNDMGGNFGLPVVYAVWIGVVVALYFPCRWFAEIKRRNKSAWLSYF